MSSVPPSGGRRPGSTERQLLSGKPSPGPWLPAPHPHTWGWGGEPADQKVLRPSVPERSTAREPVLLRLGRFRATLESHQPSGHHFSLLWGPPPEETPIVAHTLPWLPEAPPDVGRGQCATRDRSCGGAGGRGGRGPGALPHCPPQASRTSRCHPGPHLPGTQAPRQCGARVPAGAGPEGAPSPPPGPPPPVPPSPAVCPCPSPSHHAGQRAFCHFLQVAPAPPGGHCSPRDLTRGAGGDPGADDLFSFLSRQTGRSVRQFIHGGYGAGSADCSKPRFGKDRRSDPRRGRSRAGSTQTPAQPLTVGGAQAAAHACFIKGLSCRGFPGTPVTTALSRPAALQEDGGFRPLPPGGVDREDSPRGILRARAREEGRPAAHTCLLGSGCQTRLSVPPGKRGRALPADPRGCQNLGRRQRCWHRPAEAAR